LYSHSLDSVLLCESSTLCLLFTTASLLGNFILERIRKIRLHIAISKRRAMIEKVKIFRAKSVRSAPASDVSGKCQDDFQRSMRPRIEFGTRSRGRFSLSVSSLDDADEGYWRMKEEPIERVP